MRQNERIQIAVEVLAALQSAILNQDWTAVREAMRKLRPLARFSGTGEDEA